MTPSPQFLRWMFQSPSVQGLSGDRDPLTLIEDTQLRNLKRKAMTSHANTISPPPFEVLDPANFKYKNECDLVLLSIVKDRLGCYHTTYYDKRNNDVGSLAYDAAGKVLFSHPSERDLIISPKLIGHAFSYKDVNKPWKATMSNTYENDTYEDLSRAKEKFRTQMGESIKILKEYKVFDDGTYQPIGE